MPIFISYSSKDQKTAEAICTAIENRGYPCWISSRDIGPGENFQSQIVRAIRHAKIMVLVFSSHANNSEEIKKELVLAGQSQLVVIPVRVEDVTPDDAFAYEFATRQWIDVFGDWEHAIGRVMHQIEGILGEAGEATPATSAMVEKEAEAHPLPPAEPPPPPPPVVATPPPAPATRKSPMGAILGAAVAVIVVLAGVLAWQIWLKPGASPSTTASIGPVTTPTPTPAKPPAPTPQSAPITIPPAAQTTPPAPMPAAPPTPAPASPAAEQPASAPQPAPQPSVASNAPPQTFRDCPNCPEMVVIPAGSFTMGAAPGENQKFEVPMVEAGRDGPQHQVTIAKPFALAKFDVTHGEFAAFAGQADFRSRPGCQTVIGNEWMPQPRANWREPGFPQTERDPVVCMNEFEIGAYLRWLREKTGKDYRLPSEAEWEYAERGGTTTAFYWGDEAKDSCAYENVGDEDYGAKYGVTNPIPCKDGFADLAPVGSFKPNPFGLYDMAGNLFVMVADCWNETYAGAPTDGSAWREGECLRHVVRKAAFGNPHAWMFRSANRQAEGPIVRRNRGGFRVALSMP